SPAFSLPVSFRLDRFELKFVVGRTQRDLLWPHLCPHLRADENAGESASYPIVTLYYDNLDRDCYWEKARGAASRRKLRVRVYGSLDGTVAPASFLEVKHKCDRRGVKRRVKLPLETALRVAAGASVDAPLASAERRVIEEVHRFVRERDLRPICCLRFLREAFAGREENTDLRITFDSQIGYRMDRLSPQPDDRDFDRILLPDGASVMEVKVTGTVPYWLSRLIAKCGCILQSHSKYSNALEAGDPVLRGMLSGAPKRCLPVAGETPPRDGTADSAAGPGIAALP
nr:polyphosphate polymerase domain-containing protein [Verrucomicrobiota bacterium]